MLKNKIVKLVSLLLVSFLVVGLVGCGSKANVDEVKADEIQSSIDKIKEAGKIVLGTSADYPPYEFHKEVDGKDTIIGFDIEIANEIAKDLGVELVIKDMKFDGLLAALDSGNIDFVVAGMTPTPEREENVDFSEIYYQAVQSLVVRAEDVEDITSFEDLEGKKVGAQMSSIQEEIASEQIIGAQIKALGKMSDLILEIKNNKIDAVVIAKPVADAYVAKNPDLVVTDIQFEQGDDGSAVAVKEGNAELVEAINNTLKRLNESDLIDKFVTEATEGIE